LQPGSITQPNWIPTLPDEADNKQARRITIQAKPAAGLWTRVTDFIPAGRKLKILVVDTPEWIYDAAKAACAPDGAPLSADAAALLPQAVLGCLIGKVGGSSADVTTQVAALTGPIANPPIFVFSVGTYCVVQVPTTISGALFLTMNDKTENFVKHSGSLQVQVYDAS